MEVDIQTIIVEKLCKVIVKEPDSCLEDLYMTMDILAGIYKYNLWKYTKCWSYWAIV